MSLYLDVIIKNYFNFNGRARRKEFWSYFVVHVLVILFCYFIHNKIFYLYLILTRIHNETNNVNFPIIKMSNVY